MEEEQEGKIYLKKKRKPYWVIIIMYLLSIQKYF